MIEKTRVNAPLGVMPPFSILKCHKYTFQTLCVFFVGIFCKFLYVFPNKHLYKNAQNFI